MKCNVQRQMHAGVPRGVVKGGGGCCRLAVRAHTAMQIWQCPLAARVCVQRHVWHAVTFLPLLSAPAAAPLPSTASNPYS